MKTKILSIHIGLITLLSIQCSCTAIAQEHSFSTLPVVGTTNQIDGYPVMSCNIEDLKDTIQIKLSDLTESLQIVKLENNDSSLVKPHSLIASISDNYILIRPNGQPSEPAKLFNKQGKFLQNIGEELKSQIVYVNKTSGEPVRKEFPTKTLVYSYQINEKNKSVYFMPWNTCTLLGEKIGKKKNEIYKLACHSSFPKAVFHVQDTVLHVMGVTFKPQTDTYTAFSQGLHTTEHMLNKVSSLHYARTKGMYSNEIRIITNTDRIGVVFTSPNQSDTLYHYNPNSSKLTPVFILNTKKEICYYNELPNYYYGGFYVMEQISPSTSVGGKNTSYIVDKKTGRGGIVLLINDYLGNEIQEAGHFYFNEGYFRCTIEPLELKELLTKSITSKNLSSRQKQKYAKLRDSIKSGDNSYVLYAKLKK